MYGRSNDPTARTCTTWSPPPLPTHPARPCSRCRPRSRQQRQIKAGLLCLRRADGLDLKPASCDDIPLGSRARLNAAFTHKRTRVKINIVDHSRQPLKEAKPNTEVIQVRGLCCVLYCCMFCTCTKRPSEIIDSVCVFVFCFFVFSVFCRVVEFLVSSYSS